MIIFLLHVYTFDAIWRIGIVYYIKNIICSPLFRKKRFALNFLFRLNASKFAIFMEKENPYSIFSFFISSNLESYLMNAQVYVDIFFLKSVQLGL